MFFRVMAALAVGSLAFFAGCSNPADGPNNPGGAAGTLTIRNLPGGADYAVGVYNHSGAIDSLLEWANVASNIIAAGEGTVSSSMTLYAANTSNVFTGTGSYMIALYTTGAAVSVLYQTGVSFTNGCAAIDYNSMTNLLGSGPGGGGSLEILNFPEGGSLAITVYDYDEEITSMTDITGVQTDMTKLLAVSFGLAASSPASLIRGGGLSGSFNGTGTYLVILAAGTIPYYAEQVEFVNGSAAIDYDKLELVSDLPLTAGGTGEPIADINAVGAYLASQKGGSTAGKAINLVMTLALSEDNWKAILQAIETAGKFVNLDLSACLISGDGGGLRSDGTFDPIREFNTGKEKVVSLTLPNAAEKIQPGYSSTPSFQYFGNLKSVSGAYVEEIGNNAFNGVQWYGYEYRQNLEQLTAVNFPSVTVIGDSAFSYCRNLASVYFPNAESVGDRAFSGCASLTSLSFPAVESIGEQAFGYCASLTSIFLPIVESIGNGAFSGCTSLTSISFPATLNVTGNTFGGCTSLTSFTPIGAGSLSTLEGGKILVRNNNELAAYPSASGNITVGSPITKIGDGAFRSCANLTSVTIGNGVTSIGGNAFEYCYNLTSVTIGNDVTSIGYQAFYNCGNLTSVTIPDNVTNIGNEAFNGCNLTSITIGSGVTNMNWTSFSYFSNLTSINVVADNTAYSSNDGVLYNKDKTTLIAYSPGKTDTSFTVPNSVTSIGGRAFGNCQNLISVTMPNNVTSIGGMAFEYCYNIASVTIGNGVTSIAWYAFVDCRSLTSVTFQGTIPSSGFFDNGRVHQNAFPGDLRTKFYAADPDNGTPGTYTTTAPTGDSSEWTKQ
jgi:hypothetical protein